MTNKKTEEMIEEWDWDKAEPTGRAVSRKLAHKTGIPHESVHLWIVRTVRGFPELLFQYRAKQKELYPDCLDITVGGHVPFGKTNNKIQKESYEEIGISPGDEELVDLGYYKYEEVESDMIHREFQRVYLLIDNRPLDEYKFVDGEVEGIYAFALENIELLLKGKKLFNAELYDGKKILKEKVSREKFHPLLFAASMENYMRRVIAGIKDLLESDTKTIKMSSIGIEI